MSSSLVGFYQLVIGIEHFFHGAFALGDVVADRKKADDLAFAVFDGHHRQVEPERVVGFAPVAYFAAPDVATVERFVQVLEEVFLLMGHLQEIMPFADQFFGIVPADGEELLVSP